MSFEKLFKISAIILIALMGIQILSFILNLLFLFLTIFIITGSAYFIYEILKQSTKNARMNTPPRSSDKFKDNTFDTGSIFDNNTRKTKTDSEKIKQMYINGKITEEEFQEQIEKVKDKEYNR